MWVVQAHSSGQQESPLRLLQLVNVLQQVNTQQEGEQQLHVWLCTSVREQYFTQCREPECPLGSILYVYFVLLPRMVSGSGFLPYMS